MLASQSRHRQHVWPCAVGLRSEVRTNEAAHWTDQFGGLSRADAQPSSHRGSLHHCWYDGESRVEFRGSSELRTFSWFHRGNVWLRVKDTSSRRKTGRVNPEKGGSARERDAQSHRFLISGRRQSTVQIKTWPVGVSSFHQEGVAIYGAPTSLVLSPSTSSSPVVQSHLPSFRRFEPSLSCMRGRLGCFGRRDYTLKCSVAQVCW